MERRPAGAAARRASAVPGELTDDAYTIGGSPTNTGVQGILHVIDAGASTQKTFIQFDLSSMSALPSPLTSADVDKASLTLFVDGVGASGSINVREVTSTCSESTISGTSEPTIGSTVTSFMVTDSRKFVVIDITDLVKAWLDAPATNHGVALAPTTPGSGLSVSFDSKENGQTSHDPSLEVTLIGPDGLTGPTGPAGATGATGPTGGATRTSTATTTAPPPIARERPAPRDRRGPRERPAPPARLVPRGRRARRVTPDRPEPRARPAPRAQREPPAKQDRPDPQDRRVRLGPPARRATRARPGRRARRGPRATRVPPGRRGPRAGT